jgi:hypothetical protein
MSTPLGLGEEGDDGVAMELEVLIVIKLRSVAMEDCKEANI